MEVEEWRDVVGYEGLYKVSNLGRVVSVGRICNRKNGKPLPIKSKIKVLQTDKWGRKSTNLWKKNKRVNKRIHQLVMQSFVGDCPDNMEVCHNDGNASNNKLNNLRYDTSINNQNDKILHGTIKRGEKHYRSKLKANDVFYIRDSYSKGIRVTDLSKKYNVNHKTISSIVHRINWKHL